MDEKVKNKDAEAAKPDPRDDLQKALEETFPASDPVSSVQPDPDKAKTEKTSP